MKKLFFTLALATLSWASQAQTLPNAGLENWTLQATTEKPNGWLTTDDVLTAKGAPFSLQAVTKTTDKYAGTFAAKLVNTVSATTGFKGPGMLAVGSTVSLASATFGGIPFTSRPKQLQFYYKQTGTNVAADSAQALVMLTRSVNRRRVIVGYADTLLQAAPSTYTRMSMRIRYALPVLPDSAFIMLFSGTADNITAGNALYVDELSLLNTTTATRDALPANTLQVYPNPSSDGRFTLQATLPGAGPAELRVSDQLGRLVQHGTYTPGQPAPLDLSQQPAGIYLLELRSGSGTVRRPVVVR